MALYNKHVCPVDNCKCGTLPPESCFFSLICSTGSFIVVEERSSVSGSTAILFHTGPGRAGLGKLGFSIFEIHIPNPVRAPSALAGGIWRSIGQPVMVIGLLRYGLVVEKHQNCASNLLSSRYSVRPPHARSDKKHHRGRDSDLYPWEGRDRSLGIESGVDYAKILHYVGAGVAFPTSMLFVCGVFFVQESYALQHASAIFEWIFCIIIMLFYGTFAFEFGGVTSDTLMVLARGGGAPGALSRSGSGHKSEGMGVPSRHTNSPESIAML
ncbi:hypothetical protein JZ751_007998 [Albula glossodonta]|uniref:Uncharacterized protein n=1 Tax=Albula glossodonta TaxID=121402 RepID=A0A8T2P0R0_9TELE|nr:hypothetical protein JZ751_007998 [Albula glossodonta]